MNIGAILDQEEKDKRLELIERGKKVVLASQIGEWEVLVNSYKIDDPGAHPFERYSDNARSRTIIGALVVMEALDEGKTFDQAWELLNKKCERSDIPFALKYIEKFGKCGRDFYYHKALGSAKGD